MWYYLYPDTEKVKDQPYYLYSIGQHELQPHIAKPQGDSYDQFFYGTKGCGTLVLNKKAYNIPEGYGFFIPANVPHEYYPLGDEWDLRWLAVGGFFRNNLYQKVGLTGGVYHLDDIQNLEILMKKMHQELVNDAVNGNLFASTHIDEYILEFSRQASLISGGTDDSIPDAYTQKMAMLKDYVHYHFMHKITGEELAELLNVTPQHLCRITKKCVGMSPTEYIISVRLNRAKELLKQSTDSIYTIAKWCGFENDNYFWKTFKKNVGITPGEYRRRYLETK